MWTHQVSDPVFHRFYLGTDSSKYSFKSIHLFKSDSLPSSILQHPDLAIAVCWINVVEYLASLFTWSPSDVSLEVKVLFWLPTLNSVTRSAILQMAECRIFLRFTHDAWWGQTGLEIERLTFDPPTVILEMRLYAMYSKSKKVLGLLVFLFLAELGVPIFLFEYPFQGLVGTNILQLWTSTAITIIHSDQ